MNNLMAETEFINYLKLLQDNKNDYIIIIAVKDTMGAYVGVDGCQLLSSMGLTQLGDGSERRYLHWKGYISIIDGGKTIFEKLSSINKSVYWAGEIGNKVVSTFSAPCKNSNMALITIDKKEYAVNKRGLNIVVIDKTTFEVLDSVCFDTFKESRPALRLIPVIKPRPADSYYIKKDIDAVINNLKIENILPEDALNMFRMNFKKIKVRFFFWGGYNLWNALESVVDAFKYDPVFDVLVVQKIKDFNSSVYIARTGTKIIYDADYIIEDDQPDIVIYNWVSYTKTCKTVKLRVDISPCMVAGGKHEYDINSLCKAIVDENKVDAVIVEKYLYNDIVEKQPGKKELWYGFSNPQFDLIYKLLKNKPEIPKDWEKLQGKKIILWAFDHVWNTANVTFDLYIKEFLKICKKYSDIGLIIRPHRNYPLELITRHVWSINDYELMKLYCSLSENIVWDENFDYSLSYSLADAVITDVNCGILVSSLALDKPIAVLNRYDGNKVEPQYPDIIDSIYQIDSVKMAEDFFKNICFGSDPLKKERKAISKKYMDKPDGKNGERIKEFIVNKYREQI